MAPDPHRRRLQIKPAAAEQTAVQTLDWMVVNPGQAARDVDGPGVGGPRDR